MAKYKVLKEFVLNGKQLNVGDIVDLDYVKANLKSIQGNIEKAPESMATTDGSVIGSLKPGVQLTEEQKKKLATENAAESAQAHQMAAEQRGRDVAEGKADAPVKVVAEALKEKLELGQFSSKTPADNAQPNEPTQTQPTE